jgi:ribosomal protein L11 methyltransferase
MGARRFVCERNYEMDYNPAANRQELWSVSVTTAPEAEEGVVELFQRAFNQNASSYTSLETGATKVTVYLPHKPIWQAPALAAFRKALYRSAAFRLQRQAQLSALHPKGCAPGTPLAPRKKAGPPRLFVKRVRWEDWAESWKRHFKPLAIGSSLLIRPSWCRKRPRAGQVTVVLDPGLSFGTGQHPTTAFCLRQIVARRRPGKSQSFLDLGTGSGILAIAAAKLGYAPVDALDFDAEAVRIAQANAQKNHVAERIHIRRQDVSRLARRGEREYSLVCANLQTDLLLPERDRILARLDSSGMLVLAGIMKTEFNRVRRAYEAAGLGLVASRTEHEWRSGTFRWRPTQVESALKPA